MECDQTIYYLGGHIFLDECISEMLTRVATWHEYCPFDMLTSFGDGYKVASAKAEWLFNAWK